MKVILHIALFLINCLWGVLQSFLGFVLFMRYINKPHFWHKGSIVTTSSVPAFVGGMSLGVFIFMTVDVAEVKRGAIFKMKFLNMSMGISYKVYC